jgi:hypothetical protein
MGESSLANQLQREFSGLRRLGLADQGLGLQFTSTSRIKSSGISPFFKSFLLSSFCNIYLKQHFPDKLAITDATFNSL